MTPFGREPFGDVFFDRLWPEWQRDMGEEWTPSMNFYEKEGKYYLRADLPGMSKDDISITLDKGIVTVRGKKEETKEEKGANYYLKESAYGSFSRSFRLPSEVDEEKVNAVFKDGVLTLEMTQKSETAAKKVQIK
jgi:HSP20 family protein